MRGEGMNWWDSIDLDPRIRGALKVAAHFGQEDGAHHKAWVVDQMVRSLLGSPEAYAEWVRMYEAPDLDDDPEDGGYTWDTGIAP